MKQHGLEILVDSVGILGYNGVKAICLLGMASAFPDNYTRGGMADGHRNKKCSERSG